MSAFEREMGWIFWALEVMLSSVLYIPRNSKQCLSYLFLKNICRQLMATLSTAVGMFISHVSEQIRESRNGLVKKKIMPETLWLLESAGNCSVSNFSSPSYLLRKALFRLRSADAFNPPLQLFFDQSENTSAEVPLAQMRGETRWDEVKRQKWS